MSNWSAGLTTVLAEDAYELKVICVMLARAVPLYSSVPNDARPVSSTSSMALPLPSGGVAGPGTNVVSPTEPAGPSFRLNQASVDRVATTTVAARLGTADRGPSSDATMAAAIQRFRALGMYPSSSFVAESAGARSSGELSPHRVGP